MSSISSFTPSVNLDNGVYTWTVRAIDAVGNASGYVSPQATFVISATTIGGEVYLPIVVKDN